jgi:hypothetical protein
MKKKRAIRVHAVKATINNFELTKAGTSTRLEIYASEQKLGELEVGRGSFYWTGRNRQKSKRLNWSKFAEMMDKLAYGDKK